MGYLDACGDLRALQGLGRLPMGSAVVPLRFFLCPWENDRCWNCEAFQHWNACAHRCGGLCEFQNSIRRSVLCMRRKACGSSICRVLEWLRTRCILDGNGSVSCLGACLGVMLRKVYAPQRIDGRNRIELNDPDIEPATLADKLKISNVLELVFFVFARVEVFSFVPLVTRNFLWLDEVPFVGYVFAKKRLSLNGHFAFHDSISPLLQRVEVWPRAKEHLPATCTK